MSPQGHPSPIILAVETSCDDTACAVIDGSGRVLSSVVSSQLAAHRPYGGVVPEIASREHLLNWPSVGAAALEAARVDWSDIDAVAATSGPGLMGSLLVGLSLGKSIAYGLQRPFHAVHHLEGHLVSPFLPDPPRSADGSVERPPAAPVELPRRFVGLVVSGGHTSLFEVDGEEITTVAETRDDAFGEVFDKVGKALGLPYPQGPIVDSLAELGSEGAETLPIASTKASLDFSYSGLKTETLGRFDRLRRQGVELSPAQTEPPFAQPVLDVLTAFRYAAVEQILRRLRRYHRRNPMKRLAVSGGAAANRLLRRQLTQWAREAGVELHLVPLTYAGDNAAMIAYAALLQQLHGRSSDLFSAEAFSRRPLGQPPAP
ncbi:MAG: tRNA (adenosine(37)-N6)-threonylcarbamoyltransferase complex transferase subunit TsaD [Acidobacteriota bacterium]